MFHAVAYQSVSLVACGAAAGLKKTATRVCVRPLTTTTRDALHCEWKCGWQLFLHMCAWACASSFRCRCLYYLKTQLTRTKRFFFRVSWCLASVKIMWHWPHSYLISNVAISFVAPVAKRLKEKVRQCVRVYAVCSHIRTQHSTNIWTHCVITLCVWAQSTESSCTIANIAPNVADSNGTPWLHSLWSRYNEPKRLNVCPCVTIFSSDILTTFMQSLNE